MSGALVICGPTSSGKSALALAVAREVGAEIVNADSRQIYRDMNIGTGSPPPADLALVPHHLYAFLDPAERYSAARYAQDAGAVVRDIAARGRLPLVVGGTGFYIEALTGSMPLDRPPGDEGLRERLHAEARIHPPGVLWDWLAALAPASAAQTRASDSYRIMRALEVELARRDQAAHPMPHETVQPSLECEIVVVHLPRARLRERIAMRVRSMFELGLVEEAQAVRARSGDAPALTGLGYAEAIALLDGLATRDEAIARAIHRTQRYAKRQETWFRRMRDACVVDTTETDAAIRTVIAKARERLAPA